MKNFKNLLFTFISLFLIGIINVDADAYNYVEVNGVNVSSDKATITTEDVDASGSKILEKGKVTFDATNNVLTLEDVVINANTSTANGVIHTTYGSDLTINLIGDNIITNEGSSSGINSNSNLVITGTGKLTINTAYIGIYAGYGNLTIKDTKLNVTSTSRSAIQGNENAIIDNSSLNLQSALNRSAFKDFLNVELKNNNNRTFKASRTAIDSETESSDISEFSNYAKSLRYLTLLNEYTITVNKDENSTVTLPNATVTEGETVVLTITANKGYKLTSVLVNNTESLTKLVEDKLTLTVNEDTTIKVTSKAYETTIETPVIDTTKEVKEVTIGVDADKTVNETLEKALEDSELDVSTFDSKIEIAVETKKESDVPETELESINTLVKTKENMKVSTFFDITINVVNTENNNVIGTLTELNKELTFKVQLPTDLAKVEEGYTRTYNIIRYHDGESTLLDATLEGNILTFKTDKFSTYAVAYTDVKSEDKVIDNPKTLDNIALYGVTGIISLIGFASIMYVMNKKRKNN